jgi:predicted glycosyltransferase
LLVHSDPTFVSLEESYGDVSDLADRLIYTGIVVPEISQARQPGSDSRHVICSVGGRREWHLPTVLFLQV